MKTYIQSIKTILLAIILSFGISFVYAWTGPTTTPPLGNVSTPLNTSTNSQYKNGALGVGGVFRGYSSSIFDGNVGIGTTNAGDRLTVVNTTENVGETSRFEGRRHSVGDARAYPISWRHIDGPANWWGLAVDTTGNVALHRSGLADAINFNYNNLNVGIGTAAPVDRLEVAGGIRSTGSANDWNNGNQLTLDYNAGNARINATNPGVGTATLGLWTNSSERMKIDSAGNVGIGTTNPVSKLEAATSNGATGYFASFGQIPLILRNTDTTNNNWNLIDFMDNASHMGSIGVQNTNHTTPSADIVFGTVNGPLSEKMRITASGNVGIGTAAPSQKLEVSGGAIKATGGLIIETRTSDPVGPIAGQMWLRTDL